MITKGLVLALYLEVTPIACERDYVMLKAKLRPLACKAHAPAFELSPNPCSLLMVLLL